MHTGENLIDGLKYGTANIKTADISSYKAKEEILLIVDEVRRNIIENLVLRNKKLQLSDIIHLAQAIASNTSLVSLDLSENEFASHSCLVLGRALEVNTTLKKLILDQNDKIDGMAVDSLLIGLKNNKTLRHISLVSNLYCPTHGLKIIQSCLFITEFNLDCFSGWQRVNYNSVPTVRQIARPLAETLKTNFTIKYMSIGQGFDLSLEAFIYGVAHENQSYFQKLARLASSLLVTQADLGNIALSLPALFDSEIASRDVKQFCLIDTAIMRDSLALSADQFTKLNGFINAVKMPMFVKDIYLVNGQYMNKRAAFMQTMCRYYLAKSGGLKLDVSSVERDCAAYYSAWRPQELINRDVESAVRGIETLYQAFLVQQEREAAARAAQIEELGYDPDDETRWSCQRWGRQLAEGKDIR